MVIPPTLKCDEIPALPITSKLYSGDPVFTPTLPVPLSTLSAVPAIPTSNTPPTVAIPVALKLPDTLVSPLTSSLWVADVVPIPALLDNESAKIRSVAISRPFFTTKFLLIAIGSPEVHVSPHVVVVFLFILEKVRM